MGTVPSIRVSRARARLSVRVYPDARVEVVVPPRARPREVELFLAAHRQWIDDKRAAACATARRRSRFRPRACDLRASRAKPGACTWRAARAGCGSPQWRQTAAASCSVSGSARTDASLRTALRAWLMRAAQARLAPRVAALAAATGVRYSPGFHPPPAFALGKLFGARYHQPQLLPAVPASRSGRLPHRARAHAREAHESLGAFLAGGGAALPGLARARSRARAGLAPRAALGFFRRRKLNDDDGPTTRSI